MQRMHPAKFPARLELHLHLWHSKRLLSFAMSPSATSISPPVIVSGLSWEPNVAIKFEPSRCENISWPFSSAHFLLTVALSSLINSPLIRRSFWSLYRKATLTSRAQQISFSVASRSLRRSFETPNFWRLAAMNALRLLALGSIWIVFSSSQITSFASQPSGTSSFLIISNQKASCVRRIICQSQNVSLINLRRRLLWLRSKLVTMSSSTRNLLFAIEE